MSANAVLGRFQPFCAHHTLLVEDALQDNPRNLTFFMGSSGLEPSIKNPFTLAERIFFIKNQLESCVTYKVWQEPDYLEKNIEFISIYDNPSDDEWALQFKNWWRPTTLYAKRKEGDSGAYFWDFLKAKNYLKDIVIKDVPDTGSATGVRSYIYNWDSSKLISLGICSENIDYLEYWRKSELGKRIAEQYLKQENLDAWCQRELDALAAYKTYKEINKL